MAHGPTVAVVARYGAGAPPPAPRTAPGPMATGGTLPCGRAAPQALWTAPQNSKSNSKQHKTSKKKGLAIGGTASP